MYIREVLESLDTLVFDKPKKLKRVKYENIEIFEDGWKDIDIAPPPSNTSKIAKSEIEDVIKQSDGASDETKQKYINCAEDPCYYIKEYMEEVDIEFDENHMDYIVDQCTPVIRHFKNQYNRPRPYQLAEALGMKVNKWKTGTANSPSYPSGHSMQPYMVANYYAKKHPEHEGNLRDMADICAWGRVQAGLHYPSDYNAGIKLADECAKYLSDGLSEEGEGAPVNATGAAVSTHEPIVRKKKDKTILGLLKRNAV